MRGKIWQLTVSVLLSMMPLATLAYDVTFTTNAAISATDTSFDNQSILVDGATLTVDGEHGFTDLCLTNNAVLTHPPTTVTSEHSLRLFVTDSIRVSADSSIGGTGLGYLPGYTYGNTTEGGTTGAAGGSYGGLGAPLWGTPCVVYGDFRNPNEPGSGSGTYRGGGAGGGLVRLTANVLDLAGSINVNGADHPNTGGGGGSGGGVYLNVGTLRGTGAITANGGRRGSDSGSGGGGGGGRIAIHYGTVEGFDLTNSISCIGEGGDQGSAGTVYLKKQGQPGTVIVDSRNDGPNLATPLWIPDGTEYSDNVTLRGTGLLVRLASSSILPMDMHILNGAKLTHPAATTNEEYKVELAVSGTLMIDAESSIDAAGHGYLPGYTYRNTTEGGTTGAAGGSYGGLGAPLWGTPCVVYGDFRNPNEPGSGSGTYRGGGAGGGLVRLTANVLDLAGSINVNGADHPNTGGGGGSGGGVYLNAGTLRGTGAITANGGRRGSDSGSGGGGGGGRIAVHYGTVDAFDLTNSISCIGQGGNQGSAGTIYLKKQGLSGTLIVDSRDAGPDLATPLWIPEGTEYSENVTLRGTGLVVRVASSSILPMDMHIVSGAKLTHPAATTNEEYKVELAVSGTLMIDAESSIDAAGHGYLPGYTYRNTTEGGTTGAAGGSYGGLGAPLWGTPCAVYGDFRNPDEPGSGSGTYRGGGAGGGLIRLTANVLDLAGSINVNGADHPNTGGGGGSGGGVYLNAGTLRGTGAITANGGRRGSDSGSGGGGGGGRIAIHYGTVEGFDLTNSISCIGQGGNQGSAGTIYLKKQGLSGTLIVDSRDAGPDLATPLWIPDGTEYSENVTLRGTGLVVRVASSSILPMDMHIVSGAKLTHPAATTNEEYKVELAVSGTLMIDAESSIDAAGHGYLPGYTYGNTTEGGTTGAAGGSYGGLGAPLWGTPCAVYGDFRNPDEPGSGSGTYRGGGAGGGLIRLTANVLDLAGSINVNGADHPNTRGGGGSGGGIRLNVGTLRGTGTISANGGRRGSDSGSGGGGGGGRIALYYNTIDGFDIDNNMTCVGTGGNAGSPGSIFLTNELPFLAVASSEPSGTISNAVEDIGITFDSAVQAGSFTLDDVVLHGPTGPVAIAGVSQNSTFEFALQPSHSLAAGGDYTLCVGPAVSTILGQPMEAAYTNTFSIDIPTPDMPLVTNLLSAPATNMTTNAVVTLEGTRDDNSSVWINDSEAIANGCGPWTIDRGVDEGLNLVAVFAKNLAGTASSTNSILVLRDSVPPVIVEAVPSDGTCTSVAPAEITFTCVEETSGIDMGNSPRVITRNGLPVSGSWEATADTLTFSPAWSLLDGAYGIAVTLKDRCGLSSIPFESSFSIDTAVSAAPPPPPPPPVGTEGTLFMFDRPLSPTGPPNPDSDGDGLEDSWEIQHVGDLLSAADDDLDGDGLTNAEEMAAGSDPWAADTDRDGIDDSDDEHPVAATDSDSDGLPDDWEIFWFGDLNQDRSGDYDGDGRSNGIEHQEGGNPILADATDAGKTIALVVHTPLE